VNIDINAKPFVHPFSTQVQSIVKINNLTVKFILTNPLSKSPKENPFLENLAAYYSVILSQEYANDLLASAQPELIDFFPIGTGPYQFLSGDSFHTFRFQSNPHYWDRMAKIDNLIFDVTPNSTKRYAKLISNQCDIIAYPAPSQVNYIIKSNQFKVNVQSTDNISIIAFNTRRAPLKNLKLRQILAQNIKKTQIIKSIYFTTPMSNSHLVKDQSWMPYFNEQENDQLAREKLQTMSIDNSKPLIILTALNPTAFNADPHKTGKLIEARLKQLGLKSRVYSLQEGGLQKRLQTGNYDIYITGTKSHQQTPRNIFLPLLSCDSTALEGNTSRWCSGKTEALLDQISTINNEEDLDSVYHQLKQQIADEVIYLPITFVSNFNVTQKNISGVRSHSLSGIDFSHTTKKVRN
jgi:cationic peptide transport system substrate-binding protein